MKREREREVERYVDKGGYRLRELREVEIYKDGDKRKWYDKFAEIERTRERSGVSIGQRAIKIRQYDFYNEIYRNI